MGNLKKRLDRIEEKTGGKDEEVLLFKFPEKPFTHGDRSFPSVEAAVEILEKERGRKVKVTVLEVVFVSPGKVGRETSDEGRV